jgi:hypothetical protein
LSSFACPASPTSGMRRWRLYRARCASLSLTGTSTGSPASFQAEYPPDMLRTRVYPMSRRVLPAKRERVPPAQ